MSTIADLGSDEQAFRESFAQLTSHEPFPWQVALYLEMLEAPPFRAACDLPTGLGKTSVIAIWLLALAERARRGDSAGFPRRLVYVVNRRTVVDQSTREAEMLRESLERPQLTVVRQALFSLAARSSDADERPLLPLAISTLRGEFADNAEWRDDPARPAIIVGTVDMIGSRLLFAGYGSGFKSRPLHAGFLGQNVLLVHDEAHLEPAFQRLLEQIVKEQYRAEEFGRLHVMALTATRRDDEGRASATLLGDADRAHPEVGRRLNARKSLVFHTAEPNALAAKIASLGLIHKDRGLAILIYARKLEDVDKIADVLHKNGCKDNVQRLTGTMRGRERELLIKNNRVFDRFLKRDEPHASETVYLICTSAGEVGIDMSADHLVCDLTPFDSMAQRFGRVNRYGTREARIDIVCPESNSGGSKDKKNSAGEEFEERCRRTLELLQSLADHNASPIALACLPAANRAAAFTPEPVMLPVTDILFDAWALTTARDLPGRPPVAAWLHGIAEWETPETRVAWREEVEILNAMLTADLPWSDGLSEQRDQELLKQALEKNPPEDLLDDYPLKPHELLRDRYDRVFDQLSIIAKRTQNLPIWIVGDHDVPEISTLNDLLEQDKDALRYKTIILPPQAGGMSFVDGAPTGLLDGKAAYVEGGLYDVADEWFDEDHHQRRCRVWDTGPPDGAMRLVRVIDTCPTKDETESAEEADQPAQRRFWRWYVRPRSADDEGSRVALEPQGLQPHLRCAGDFADAIVTKLEMNDPEAAAIKLAARWHDLGKCRRVWQLAIGNRDYPETVLAKSGSKRMRVLDLNHYRHELGSLIDLEHKPEFKDLDGLTRDLVMHLIAAHHGRARPHFPSKEIFDLEREQHLVDELAREVPQRFARLQRRYGRWGLAYLESLLRAADIMASQEKLSETSVTATSQSPAGDVR